MPGWGPLPVTPTSYPFRSRRPRARAEGPQSVPDYVEEEFLVAEPANVYDWPAPGQQRIRTAGVPTSRACWSVVPLPRALQRHGHRGMLNPSRISSI